MAAFAVAVALAGRIARWRGKGRGEALRCVEGRIWRYAAMIALVILWVIALVIVGEAGAKGEINVAKPLTSGGYIWYNTGIMKMTGATLRQED